MKKLFQILQKWFGITIQNKTAANEQFAKMAALARPKFCLTLQPCGSSERQWRPPLRQAAGTLAAIRGLTV